MKRRAFGRYGFEVSEVALGTWGLSGDPYGPVREDLRQKVIERAVEHGINLFETADVYGRGNVETDLGHILNASETYVVTKLGVCRELTPPAKRFDRETLLEKLDGSEKRLKRDKLDVVLLHCPSRATIERGEACETMRGLVKEGRIAHWGVSAGSAEVASAAISQGAECIEVAYNITHSADLHGIADEVASTETALLARSVLALQTAWF